MWFFLFFPLAALPQVTINTMYEDLAVAIVDDIRQGAASSLLFTDTHAQFTIGREKEKELCTCLTLHERRSQYHTPCDAKPLSGIESMRVCLHCFSYPGTASIVAEGAWSTYTQPQKQVHQCIAPCCAWFQRILKQKRNRPPEADFLL